MRIVPSLFTSVFMSIVPVLTHAADAPGNFKELVQLFIGIIDILIYLLFTLAIIVFLWGLIQNWIIRGGNEDGVSDGKKYMEAGIIGFVVMVSLWGIVFILKNTFFG